MKTIKMMDFYTQGKQLGKGNFGITYLCTEIATGQHYACKCIQKSTLISQKHFKMVQCEIDILKLITLKEHPNIISIKDVFYDDIHVYILMELCEGGTLVDRMIENRTTFGEPKAAQLIKEIVCAIEVCHSLSIVHRDLKLENFLFQTKDKDSPLKVIDFGYAQFFKQGEILIDVIGSLSYVAPEVVEGHHGSRADIWSLGVVLYVLLAGFFPFDGNTIEETCKETMKGHHLFIKDPWPSISKGAKDLIRKMLTYNVNKRLDASKVLKHPWILKNVK